MCDVPAVSEVSESELLVAENRPAGKEVGILRPTTSGQQKEAEGRGKLELGDKR